MDLKQLSAVGGFVSDTQLKKVEKTWTNPEGEEFKLDFFVSRQSFSQVEEIWRAQENPKAGSSANAKLMASVLRFGKEGKQRMTYEQACDLESSLALVFINAINETLAPKVKPSTPSGTSSSSPVSAAEPSKKPSKT